MNCLRIGSAALIALMITGFDAPAQDREQSIAAKLLERLDRLTERLDDEGLRSDTRDELEDLMDMLREQLGRSQDTLDDASDAYRRALQGFQRMDRIDMSDFGDQLEALKKLDVLQKIDMNEIGDRLKALDALKDIDMSKLQDQLDALQGNLDRTDVGNLMERLRSNWAEQQGENVRSWREVLGDLQERSYSGTLRPNLERVRGVLEDSLKTVDDETVQGILEKVRESLQEASRGYADVGDYLRASNLYRAARDRSEGSEESGGAAGRFNFLRSVDVQEGQDEFQKYMERAREQWEKYLEESRAEMEKQMKQALDAYRKALEKKDGEGVDNPFVTWSVPEGAFSEFVEPSTWGVTLPEGKAFSFSQDPGSSAWFVTGPEGRPFKVEGTFTWGDREGDAKSFFVSPDGKGSSFFVSPPESWNFKTMDTEDPENKGTAWPVFDFYQNLKTENKDAEGSKKKPGATYLELFKKDRNKVSGNEAEIQELELQEVELVEPALELKLEPELSLVAGELKLEPELSVVAGEVLVEPELKLLREPRRASSPEDVQVQVMDMVEELRRELREIRDLVQELRKKAREQKPQ